MEDPSKIKKEAKTQLDIKKDYSLQEMLEAIILNDSTTLDKMRARLLQLNSAYDIFATEIDSGDKSRINIAISNFIRPLI